MLIIKKIKITVIDFETANQNRNSACSIGIVLIENNKIISQKEFLIKPIGSYNLHNTQIHGLTINDTKNAPTWDELYPQIKEYFNGKVVAHSGFDKSVLYKVSEYYNLKIPEKFEYIDTVQLAREKVPELKNHQLATLAKYFNIGLFTHHNALDDAIVCAKIYLRLNLDNFKNRNMISNNLSEARGELTSLIRLLEKEDNLNIGKLQIGFEHAYHHINFAWNIKFSNNNDVINLSSENFIEWSKFPKSENSIISEN